MQNLNHVKKGPTIFKLLHAYLTCFSFGTGYCYLTEVQVPTGKTPYIEKDDVIGQTSGDTELYLGALIQMGVTVNIDECNVW